MDKYIIKGNGTFEEIIQALNTLKAVFGGDATLDEIETATRYGRLKTAVRKQFDDGENENY